MIILVFAVVAMATNAQSKVTEVSTDGYINGTSYAYILGTTSDTLTDADTVTYVLRVKGGQTVDMNVQIYNDFVSGTATGKLKSYRSIDGVNYTVTAAGDSITVASITADILDSEVLNYDNFLYPYLKFIYIQAGSGVNVPKIFIYAKEN